MAKTKYMIEATFSTSERVEQHNVARGEIEKKLKRLKDCVSELECLSESFEEIKEAVKEVEEISMLIYMCANKQCEYEQAYQVFIHEHPGINKERRDENIT